ncbi:MAG: hypothetical protein H0V24_02785 [Chloroflexia bacterium]|nr:hypothetical protein [Chloroflexia bacterium]
MQRFVQFGLSIAAVAALLALVPLITGAHEGREVAEGRYDFTVGFIEEPAFVGEMNGLTLRVEAIDGDATEPVIGLDQTLEAEVIFGDQTMALELSPAFQDDGVYESVFFPMAVGDYTFRIFGEIDGTAIDESFTSAPDGFDSVQDRAPLEFPKPS